MRNGLVSALGLLPQEQRARIQEKLEAQLDHVGQVLPAGETVARVADGLTKNVRPVLFVLTDERLVIVAKSFSGSPEVVAFTLSEITGAVVYPINWATISKLFGQDPKHHNIFIGSARAEMRFFISDDSSIEFEAALRAGFQGNPAA